LSTCECYLGDDFEVTSPPVIQAPRRNSDAPKYKPTVQHELPDFVYAPASMPAHRHFLERPPK
jgi:hypothetical protein